MNEFIFGELSTFNKRLEYTMAQRRGLMHDHNLTPLTPTAADSPRIRVTAALPSTLDRVECHIIDPKPAIIPLVSTRVTWDPLNWAYVQQWEANLPAQPDGTLVRYKIYGTLAEGEQISADDDITFAYLVGNGQPPDWAAEAIVYQIFPDRFHPGRGRRWNPVSSPAEIYGGTLRGIIDHLDYVAEMGFNCIWLNPFFPDHTHHGYHATDYFAVNPRLGTLDDIHELVAAAHGRGIRLILDFVANHWGSGHESFQQALRDPNSKFYEWYNWIDWPHDYYSFFGVKDLPQLNVDSPSLREELFRAARYWLDVGFDGFRLDYAPGPSHDFWTSFRAAVKQHNPDAWLFGEAVSMPSIVRSYIGRFDGCLDFILLQALRDTFAFNTMNVGAFDAFLTNHECYFPSNFGRPSFLDNHDMNRFLWLVRGDKRKLKLAALCQFTLSGMPIVYYGTEVGLSQQRDVAHPDGRHILEESRLPMLWGEEQDEDLRAFYQWLIHLRRAHPALSHGQRKRLHLDTAAGTYAYARFDSAEYIIVAFNLSAEPHTLEAAGYTFNLAPWSGDVIVEKGERGNLLKIAATEAPPA